MKKSKGFARVEFLANLKRIQELTDKGYTKKAIYELLQEEGKISMTYIHFCRFDPYTGQISKADNQSTATTSVPTIRTVSAPPTPPDSGGDGSTSAHHENDSAFSHNRNVTEKELNEDFIGQ